MITAKLDAARGVIWYTLPELPSLFAASSLAVDESPEFYARHAQLPLVTPAHRRWVAELGFNPNDLAYLRQVHGDTIRIVTKPGAYGDADGILTPVPGVMPSVRTADCAAVFLLVPHVPVVGVLHVGWRGARLGMIEKAFQLLYQQWEVTPQQVFSAISPALHGCCFRVTDEFLEYFESHYFARRAGGWYFQFERLLEDTLLGLGIPTDQIVVVPWCTYCADIPLHSYRRDKNSRRMFNIVGITDNAEKGASYGIN